MADSGTADRIRIPVEQLTLGMYVCELDRPWQETPFLFQGFRIRHPQEIVLLGEVCQFVWVDAKRSVGLQQQVSENLLSVAAEHLQPVVAKVDFGQEIQAAEPAFHAAREHSLRLLEAARLGHELDVKQVKVVVKECVESMLRNPGAMLWLARIKNSDEYTAEHCLRVAIFSIALGRELGLRQAELEHLGMCGMLHDVGKIKVPSAILNKPGALTEEELLIMQSHAVEGRKLLMSNQQVTPAAVDVAFSHHERLDGRGYPRGLDAARIPFFAKIVAVVDAYDAINSDRPYSKGKSSLEALRILFEARGTHFDEDMVKLFVRRVGIYPPGEIVEMSNGEVGIIIGCSPLSKLKPKLLLVLDEHKQPRAERVINLQEAVTDARGRPYRVKEVYPSGAFGIDIEVYRRKGLVIPDNL
ncbi:diguanylate cyclase [Pseudomonas sp. HAR-UPW-AIA-41]|uniref:HD-GYP domain-containing protein n=1 Tax=Pseudomonas sp. HAR-UPW-AIA-41 TaxID=1985301 RepID=UPI000BB32A5A|nr:HD-GYP domain-containing protein [Pseudomonas sp. HAR-UPW-AIA-41]PAV48998.1 diguanylate cyclase [Pseudomonas sp. HAR-UPW-AIA-41]